MPRSGSYIKFAGNREDWLFLADAEWEVDPTGRFMTCDVHCGHRALSKRLSSAGLPLGS